MLAITDTAFDLLVLELVLHGLGVLVGALILGILAPGDAWSEDDVFTDGGGIGGRSRGIFGAQAELGPRFPVCDAGVHCLGLGDVADPTSRLYFLALIVVSIGDDSLSTIFVRDSLRRGEFGGDLLVVVVVGPVVPFLQVVGLARLSEREVRSLVATHVDLGGAAVAVAMMTACCEAPVSLIQKNSSFAVSTCAASLERFYKGLILSVGFSSKQSRRISQLLVRFAFSGGEATCGCEANHVIGILSSCCRVDHQRFYIRRRRFQECGAVSSLDAKLIVFGQTRLIKRHAPEVDSPSTPNARRFVVIECGAHMICVA
jgi:hypothetical protein